MSFKVGDKVRAKGAESVGVIYRPSDSSYGWAAEFEIEDERYFLLGQGEAEALGIELELVEPELPEEPHGVILIQEPKPNKRLLVAQRNPENGRWWVSGLVGVFVWSELMSEFGTDFTALRDEKEVIREVLSVLKGTGWSDNSYRLIAKHFGGWSDERGGY